MKKFISLVAIVSIFVSASSCRETEELSTIPEKNTIPAIVARIDKDSINTNAENSSTNDSNPNPVGEEKDPPPKDKIEW